MEFLSDKAIMGSGSGTKGFKESNRKERLWFVNRWAEYVKTHSDEDWSRQQAVVVNSQIQNTKYTKLDRKDYLKTKGEK